jgi:hypothetical protein
MPTPGMQGQPPVLLTQQQFNQLSSQQYAQGPSQQRPIIRSAMPDEKKPIRQETRINLPRPEQLDIAPKTPADPNAVEWNAIHTYMKSIGVVSFGMERPAEGGYRFSLVMPTAEAGRTYRIDGGGTTEAEAVRVCLDKTYRWLKQIQ